ncbi:hypothetical protein D3C78_967280 [compost metagenome]
MNPRLFAQALNKCQVGLTVLRAEIQRRVIVLKHKPTGLPTDTMLPQDLGKDLRDRLPAEDPLTETLPQTGQLRSKRHPPESRIRAAVKLHQVMNLSVDTDARLPQAQIGRAIHQAGKVQLLFIELQFQPENKGRTDGLVAGKGDNRKGLGLARYLQAK